MAQQPDGGLDVTRREFAFVGVASLATLQGGTTTQVSSQQFSAEEEFQSVAVLEGPRSARPDPDSDFFENDRRRTVYYAYRYIDEVTKASWYITQDLEEWHPEPLGGGADITGAAGQPPSIVAYGDRLFVRRLE